MVQAESTVSEPQHHCQTSSPFGLPAFVFTHHRMMRYTETTKSQNVQHYCPVSSSFGVPMFCLAFQQGTVQQILKRMEDVQSMCAKRKESLCKICDPRVRPVQSVSPAPVIRTSSPAIHPHDEADSSTELKRKTLAEESVKKSPVFLGKSARVSHFFVFAHLFS